jgi:hypothetical protein
MKTAYKICWTTISIAKVQVADDWTEDWQHDNSDYLVWATFEAAKEELIGGLQAEISELAGYKEDTYF